MQYLKVILFILLFSSICYGAGLQNVELIRISDADSFWIRWQGRKVKLIVIGVDAPEEFKSRKLRMDSKRCHISQKHIRRLGRRATSFAKSILHKGQLLKVEIIKVDKRKNKVYGRVYLSDGSSYAEILIKEGYGCVRETDKKLKERLNKQLEKAKKEKKGLWKDFYKIMDCLCR